MKNVFFGLGTQYDTGSIPAVALNRGGTVLEVHKNEAGFANRILGDTMAALPRVNRHGKIINMLYVDYVEYARVTDIALYQNGTPHAVTVPHRASASVAHAGEAAVVAQL